MEKLTSKLPEKQKKRLHKEFLENEKSYWEVRDALLPGCKGKWVAVRGGKVVAESTNVFDILDRAEEAGGHPYIARVGHEDMEFKIRRRFNYDTSYQPFALPRIVATFWDRRRNRGETYEDVIPDTGANTSLLPEQDAETIGLRAYPYLASMVRGIVGPAVPAVVYQGVVDIDGKSYRSLIQLVETAERILGRDVLNQLRITFDGPARQVEIS